MHLQAIILFLIGVGLLRGVLDIPWIYWQAGRLHLLLPSMRAPAWYALNIGPFILAETITALLRWVMFSTIVYWLARFLGGRGTFRVSWHVYGALLGITLVTILIDYLYFVLPLPLFRFSVSPRYNPVIGVGQVATSLWIGYVTYLLVRKSYGVTGWSALMIGAFVPLLNTGLFLIVTRLLLHLLPKEISQNLLMIVLNVGFVVSGLAAFAVLLRWGWRRVNSEKVVSTQR